VPLKTPGGRHLGTLCVIDREPRKLTPTQLSALETLANSVMAHLDLRQSHQEIRRYVDGLQLAAQIFESVTEAMIVTDPDNNILTVNPAFTSTTGYTREEVVGKNPNILSSGKQGPAFYQAMWHTLNSEGHWSGELWNKRKDGQLYLGWLSIRALFNEDGSKRLHLAIYSDISHKKLAEELLRTQVGLMH
jgi:PAS domain S-box-containing protein